MVGYNSLNEILKHERPALKKSTSPVRFGGEYYSPTNTSASGYSLLLPSMSPLQWNRNAPKRTYILARMDSVTNGFISLEALSTFIESQKALLERTQADIKRLKQIRDDVALLPEESCDFGSFENEVCSRMLSILRS